MEFDNEISILLKKAKEFRIPAKYVFRDRNLFQEITNLIPTGISLNKLSELYPMLEPKELALIYFLNIKPTKEILKIYNDFLSSKVELNEFKLLIEEFVQKINQEYREDMERLETIEAFQNELRNYLPLPYTQPNIDSYILYSTMNFLGKSPEITDGYEIFDLATPNLTIPYLKWDTNFIQTKELFKLYKGKTLEERPEYSKIIPISFKEMNNTFLFSVWDGDLEKDNIKEATKESYLKGLYNLNTNILRIKIPINKGKDRILNRIKSVFPLEFNEISETSVSAELFMFDIEFNDLLLSHMILNDKLINNYLFMKEMSTSFVEKKKQMKIFFRSVQSFEETDAPASIRFSINQMYANGGEVVTLSNQETLRLNQNDPYIRIKISSADSLATIDTFLTIFSRLMSRYKETKDILEETYIEYIPNFLEEKNKQMVTSIRKIGKEADTKITRLKQVAPDLFVTDYARKCLCPFQPIPIPDDEIEAWENKTFIYKGEEYYRQVLAFPPDNPKWNFVCPEDSYPFPGVRKNTLSNSGIYAGLPCCFVNDQMGEGVKSKYNRIYGSSEEEIQEVKEVDTHMIKTDKILENGRYGLLPTSISDLLSNVIKNDIFRKGVPRSINSLLHCISIAAEDPQYLAKDSEEREIYLAKLRETIAKSTLPGLLKQELYDFSDFEISSSFKEGFLDPDYYYRAIEEAYKINIFVFSPSENEEKRLKNKEESEGVLRLPRFKLFPVRSPMPDRPTICIYRTLGSERDKLEYPQCELIVSHTDEKDQALFGKDMYQLIFNANLTLSKTISWELVDSNNKIDILARENIYSRLNFYLLTEKKAKKQYIDEYGKLRGLYLPHMKEELLMVIPPSAPENLVTTNYIPRPNYKTVLNLFPNPVAVSSTLNDEIDGLWFSVLDLVYGIYIPIKPISIKEAIFSNIPLGPGNPLGEKGLEVVPRIRKLKRDLDFIIQVFKWLFSLTNDSLEDFIQKYVGVSNGVIDDKNGKLKIDSAQIYDFSNIGKTFPKVNDLESGIIEMSKRVPTLFVSGKLFIYSDKFVEGIYYLMKKHFKEYGKGEIPVSITREQLTEQDFKTIPGIALFLSEKDLRSWLSSFGKFPKIFTTINSSFMLKNEPFIYRSDDGHIYLIQNVSEGNLYRALNVNYYWDLHKVNPGFRTPEYDDEIPKYVVYGISPANSTVLIENHAGDSLSFYSVLKYNQRNYAAMLLLL